MSDHHSLRSPPKAVPGAGYRDRPFAAVIASMRAAVLGELAATLEAPGDPATGFPAPGFPDSLAPLLSSAILHPGRAALAWRAVTGRLRFARPGFEPDPLHLIVAEAAVERHPATRGLHMPVELWRAVATAAWEAPDFRLAAAQLLRDHLRERHLFTTGETPAPRLTPPTAWILLAAAADGPRPGRLAGIRARRRAWRAGHVRHLACLMALEAEGWAGYWDQWVLLRLLDRRPGLGDTLWPELTDALRTLPLAGGEPHPLVAPGWATQRPRWMPEPLPNDLPITPPTDAAFADTVPN